MNGMIPVKAIRCCKYINCKVEGNDVLALCFNGSDFNENFNQLAQVMQKALVIVTEASS